MNRSRLLALVGACVVFAAGALGVMRLQDDPKPTVNLSTGTRTPEPSDDRELEIPVDQTDDVTTTTMDLVVPSTTDTSVKKPTTSTTAKPTATTAPVDPKVAIVTATNRAGNPVKVWVGDASEHEAVLQPEQSIEWTVTQSDNGNPDAAGAVIEGTYCGGKWFDQNNLVGGRRYQLDVKTNGYCPNGLPQPKLVLTDLSSAESKLFMGPVPDGNHALIYVVNKFTAPAKVGATDDTDHGWTLNPGQWGEPAMMKTSTEHGDSAGVMRTDQQCGYGDGEDFFKGGHTYRIEVRVGGKCEGNVASPGMYVYDLTENTSRWLGASGPPLPTTG